MRKQCAMRLRVAMPPRAPATQPLLVVYLVALLARLQQNLVAQPAGQQLQRRTRHVLRQRLRVAQ
jgi:hypothetical protein